jgi:hypothetical protein
MRVYLPSEDKDAPVVVCSELPTNDGASIAYAAEQLAAEVIHYHDLTRPVVWIEHHSPETTDGSIETFDLVAFSSYEVRESALHGRNTSESRRSHLEAHHEGHGGGAGGRGGVACVASDPRPRDDRDVAQDLANPSWETTPWSKEFVTE